MNIPRFELIKIDFANYIEINLLESHFLFEVVVKKLLFGGMEAEAWRDLRLSVYG